MQPLWRTIEKEVEDILRADGIELDRQSNNGDLIASLPRCNRNVTEFSQELASRLRERLQS